MNKIEKEGISAIFQEAESDDILKQVTEKSLMTLISLTTLISFTREWKMHKHLLEKKLKIQFQEYYRCFNNKRCLLPFENQIGKKHSKNENIHSNVWLQNSMYFTPSKK